jgi:hypothetical protein
MTILNCDKCGGTHYGSLKRPYNLAPCVVCGDQTIYACSDCGIDSGGKRSVHVCEKPTCLETHEKQHPTTDARRD